MVNFFRTRPQAELGTVLGSVVVVWLSVLRPRARRRDREERSFALPVIGWLAGSAIGPPVGSFYKPRTYILFIYIYFVVETAEDDLNMRRKIARRSGLLFVYGAAGRVVRQHGSGLA